MSANVTTNTVFEAFIEADKAMKELPAAREELDRLRRDVSNKMGIIDRAMSELTDKDDEITKLKSMLSAREAELARATFRADAVEAKHRALRGILGGDDVVAVGVDSLLSELNHPKSDTPMPSQSSESGDGSRSQSEDHPTVLTTASETGSTDGMNTSGETQPQPENVTSLLGTSNNPSVEGSVPAGEEPYNELEPKPSSRQLTGDGSSDSPAALPFAGRLYTSKPNGMEWGYWIVNGGEPPYYYDADYTAALKNEYRQWAGHAKAAE